jgi:agmatinase
VITVIGIPWDGSSSSERGAAEAPALIRAALRSPSSNSFNERGDDVLSATVMADGGDLTLTDDAAETRLRIERAVREILTSSSKPLLLGGDHSVTYPILRAFREHGPLSVVHFDAHGDIYDHFEGDRYSHACPFARVMEEKLATRLIQVGIRTLTPHQRSQSKKFGTEIYGGDRWREALPIVAGLQGAVYVSLDLDVLEPMVAPGLSHPEPGGLTVRDVLEVLSALQTNVVGADVVEYNPRFDLRDLTARVAAKFVKELVGVMQ